MSSSSPVLRRSGIALSKRASNSALGAPRAISFFSQSNPASRPSQQSAPAAPQGSSSKPITTLQEANPRNLPEVWLSSSYPSSNIQGSPGAGKPESPDKNKVELGKTLSILQERLPTLLQSPLPHDILAPNISLHLFPSTHPHLPAVSGRVAYIAALWTSPIAWNRVPIVGNNKLEILSERMTHQPLHNSPQRAGAVGEQLVVRWRTIGKSKGWGLRFGGSRDEGNTDSARDGSLPGVSEDGTFTGLFIFEFDKNGKVLSHTIETVLEGGDWEKGFGHKFVGLTDWLLGGIKGSREPGNTPCPAYQWHDPQKRR